MELNCHIEGCKRPYRAKGYCEGHYKKWRSGDLPHPRYKTCKQESCRKKRYLTFSFCEEHYNVAVGKGAESKEAPAASSAKTEEVKTVEKTAPMAEEKKEEAKSAAEPDK